MWRKHVTLLGLLQAAAIAIVSFSVVTIFDFAHRNIELFAHFRLQYLAVSILLLIVFAAFRKPAYSLLLLSTGILNASFVVPWYVGELALDDDNTVKILNANVQASNSHYQRLLDLVGEEQPDLILLQEFSPAWREATQSLKSDYPFSYAETRDDSFGIAMFSRIALDSVTHVNSPPMGHPTIVAVMTVNGATVTLINTHVTTPVARTLFDARNKQIDSIVDIVSAIEGAVILTGDLNLSLWSRRYQLLEEHTGLSNTRRGFGVVPTWPTFMPFAMIPIDHALVSDGIRTVETRTGNRIGSDHLPLIIELAIGPH